MSKPHKHLTFRQISSVVAGVVGRMLCSAPRKIFLSNFEPAGKTPKSFKNKRCRVISAFFIELTHLDSPLSILRPKAKTEWLKTKFFRAKKLPSKNEKIAFILL